VVVSTTDCPSRTVWIIGGLKQPPRLRHKGSGPFSLWRSHPSFAKEGNSPGQRCTATRTFRLAFRRETSDVTVISLYPETSKMAKLQGPVYDRPTT
jgi:hypothetical protein